MKKYILSLLIFIPISLLSATVDESIQQAKTKYAAGNPSEAITILDGVIKLDPSNLHAKRVLADICVDTGEKEYDIRNFKNAYEYFKKAVKILPTHPIATERYWKMKNDFDVNNLKNEGRDLSVNKTAVKGEVKTSDKEIKKELAVKDVNPRKADEIYAKKIFDMEERFNKRLLAVNSQLKKTPEAESEKTGLAGLIYKTVSDKKLLAVSLIVLIIFIIMLIMATAYLIKFIKKQISARKGGKEYEKLFGGENSQNYNELIKMQNIKELLNKIKAGELDWNTIKRSISEMDRELRLEIFSYIESKSDAYHQPLTMWQADILTALLLDGDEYLRKRASSFTAGQLAYVSGNGGGSGLKALPFNRNNGHNQQNVPQITDQSGGSEEASILNDLNVVLLLSKITDRKVFNDNHPSKVGVDAYDMAGTLGLSQDECNLFYIAGLLHDIGYLDIPSEILNKKATLTDKEFAVIRTHTAKGLTLLDFTGIPQTVRDGILYHHEKWAGGGYPEGLAGEDIPLAARVIAIFDMYEALILPRPQRPPFPAKEAARIVKKGSGTLFDPALIKVFEQMLKDNLVSRGDIWKE